MIRPPSSGARSLASASPSHIPLDAIVISEYKLYVKYNLYKETGLS
jgi:hypothetical protein